MVQHNFGDTNWTKKCWGLNNFRVKINFIDASLLTKFPTSLTVFISIVCVKVVTNIKDLE